MRYLLEDDSGRQREIAHFALPNLPDPNQSAKSGGVFAFVVWMTVLLVLAAIIFVFGAFAFTTRSDPESLAVFIGPVSLAVGAIVGLLAPSPSVPTNGKTA